MSDQQKKPVAQAVSQQPASTPNSVFNDIDNQEIVTTVMQAGFYIRGAVESFIDEDKKQVEFAYCQILKKARDDSAKMVVMDIKVKPEQRGLIEILNQEPFKFMNLKLRLQTFGKRVDFYLADDQPSIKLAS